MSINAQPINSPDSAGSQVGPLTVDDIAGLTNGIGPLTSQLDAAIARVERYAPGAPQTIKNEAVARYAGYLAQSDFGPIRSESIGPRSVEYITNHAAAFRNCGAAGLLSPWRVRRGGRV